MDLINQLKRLDTLEVQLQEDIERKYLSEGKIETNYELKIRNLGVQIHVEQEEQEIIKDKMY